MALQIGFTALKLTPHTPTQNGGTGGGSSTPTTVNIAMFTLPWPSDVLLSTNNTIVFTGDVYTSTTGNHYVNAGYVNSGYVS